MINEDGWFVGEDMAPTALELSPLEWKKYHPAKAYHRQSPQERIALAGRRREGLRTARRAARLLVEHYGARRVVLFGSLARRGAFTAYSDIDLAAWGIPPERFFAAVAEITGMSAEFRLDLVDSDVCSPSLRATLEQDGITL
jgi:predicted nucleotidyltransferase